MLCPVARSKRSYHLDDRVIDAIMKMAKQSNTSANRFLESLVFDVAKERGILPTDAEPLGELRGGDRTNSDTDSDTN